MGLNTEERQAVIYFTGYEVEHTVCHGMKTLFVVGTPPVEEILQQANRDVDIKHIYFGTSQSFPDIEVDDAEEWHKWESVIQKCLDEGYWCTLDLDVAQVEGLAEGGLLDSNRFVPMISVKIPYIKLFNYNTTLKIDDTTWGHSNPGVWTHQLHTLMSKDNYTHWDQYTQDTEVK